MTRKIITGLVTALLMLTTLVGCTDTSGVPIAQTSSPTPPPTRNQRMMSVFDELATNPGAWTTDEIVTAAHGVCTDFTGGDNFYQVVIDATDAGFNADDAGVLIGAAVGVYCPQYHGLIPTR